jgi:hypothetical protein
MPLFLAAFASLSGDKDSTLGGDLCEPGHTSSAGRLKDFLGQEAVAVGFLWIIVIGLVAEFIGATMGTIVALFIWHRLVARNMA